MSAAGTPAANPGAMLARQVRLWRERRKLSAQALADRVRDDGGTLSRVAISKIENGDRGVSVDEWLQLAYALAVPPPLLLVDLPAGECVRIVPGAEVHPWIAWEWLVGEEPPPTSERYAKRMAEWSDALAAVRIYRREVKAAGELREAEQALAKATYQEDPEEISSARERHFGALKVLAGIFDEMVELGVVPPGQPAERLTLMRSFALLRYPDAVGTCPEG